MLVTALRAIWTWQAWTVRVSVFRTVSTLMVVCAFVACRRERPLPRLGRIPHFSLVNQSGRPFTDATPRGEVWAAAFFTTRCSDGCPRVTHLMQQVQNIAKTRSVPLHLVSFSVDPGHDTPDVLRRYAEDHGADPKTWTFVTGRADVIRRVQKEFATPPKAKAGDSGEPELAHGAHLVLVDRELWIRGYYATAGEDETGQLLVDAERLARR